MPNNTIKLILILGSLAIAGILFFQTFWVIQSWDRKEEEFNQTVMIALRKVAEKIAIYNQTDLPKNNLIQRRASNYYSVNINSVIDANILEDFLIREFNELSLNTAFEYAVYDCASDDLVYGNYCNLSVGAEALERSENLPKFNDLIYYFVVNFPSRNSYLINDLRVTVLFSILTILAVLSFFYAIWVIARQKQVTDLQKDFINNMTHEFKTPISSIKIASEVLMQNEMVDSNPRLKQYASIISNQNDRLNSQVEKVLNIAKLEKDQFKLNLEVIELIPFLEHIITQERIKYDAADGTILLEDYNEDIFIKADRLHFTNVMSNIIDNALKYGGKNPIVKIQIIGFQQYIRLIIRDSGIGISKDQLKRIFNKFYRVSTGDVHNVKGFGLGLYYVKNICDTHGWKIDLFSEINKGTSVILEIPKTINHE
ncbi:MAG: HAMP domain-containing histidine kinase [Saprospiraceae bacterium]|nr:HAMP domain-containing histidine kinase [Bacteroidia bacterium]MBT8230638.1 HAMP domain-containing histidine kinase [Bacteroidia bacterium]NNF22315.1 HAMP domain-containing histidine kinase [Saprospiraceae bacterium]NNK89979.1 HAMP domain-containing histidine kinase [Saprospiraceae bacterium]